MTTSDTNKDFQPTPEPAASQFSATEPANSDLTGTESNLSEMGESSEATIRRVLDQFDLGRKLRQLRLKKKIALVDLGKHTGLSASMLSQLENGKLIPTLPTLARIAMVFDVGIDHFFVDRKEKYRFSVVRAKDRIRFPEAETEKPAYYFECLAFGAQDKNLNPYYAEFARRAEHEVVEHAHLGTEFLFLLEGELEIRYREETFVLRPGDSAYFDSSEPHCYRGLAKDTTRAVVVTTSP